MVNFYNFLFDPIKSESEPWMTGILAFLYSSASILISLWLFPNYSSLTSVFLSTISCLYIFERALLLEERREKDSIPEEVVLRKHLGLLSLFFFVFLGFVCAYMLMALILPNNLVNEAFTIQSETIQSIRSITGNVVYPNIMSEVLTNNLKVFFMSLLFAIFYGAGAIFIIAWNASLMGFVIGNTVRETLGLSSLPIVLAKYFAHGIFEMGGYFIGALAGGILYIEIIKGDIQRNRLKRTIIDISALIILGILLIVIGSFVESYISSRI